MYLRRYIVLLPLLQTYPPQNVFLNLTILNIFDAMIFMQVLQIVKSSSLRLSEVREFYRIHFIRRTCDLIKMQYLFHFSGRTYYCNASLVLMKQIHYQFLYFSCTGAYPNLSPCYEQLILNVPTSLFCRFIKILSRYIKISGRYVKIHNASALVFGVSTLPSNGRYLKISGRFVKIQTLIQTNELKIS